MAFSVSVQDLTKYFGTKKVLSSVNLHHKEGVLGIAGSNGSGKSTLLKILAGLLPYSAGNFVWKNNGQKLKVEELKTSLGYAAPYINLYDELTTAENLKFLQRLRHQPSEKNTIDLLREFGVDLISGQLFGSLSTGQQQRVRLAAALAHDPSVLFLDEPGSNLDKKGIEAVRQAIEKRRGRVIILLASNNQRELDWCDRIYSVEENTFVES